MLGLHMSIFLYAFTKLRQLKNEKEYLWVFESDEK